MHFFLACVGISVCVVAFWCASFGVSTLSGKRNATLRPQPSFEIPAALIKTLMCAASCAWEARVGREPVAAAVDGAISLA